MSGVPPIDFYEDGFNNDHRTNNRKRLSQQSRSGNDEPRRLIFDDQFTKPEPRLSDYHIFDSRNYDGVTSEALLKSSFIKQGVVFPPVKKQGDPELNGLDKVIGYAKLKYNIDANLLSPIRAKKKKSLFGLSAKPVRGALFYGPPGNGKTFVVAKTIEELDANRFDISVSKQGSSYIYKMEMNISDQFKKAREAYKESGKPSIVVIDEADSLLKDRRYLDDYKVSAANTLLEEMGSNENEGVHVFLMTNTPGELDSAAIRSGRIDFKEEIPMPNWQSRKELFEHYLSEFPYAKYDDVYNTGGIDVDDLANRTADYTVSDIENLMDNARNSAASAGMEFVDSEAMKVALANTSRSLNDQQIADFEKSSREFEGNNF